MSYPEKPRSNWWYILPILFGLIPGGLVAYFLLKKESPIKAKTCLCVSIVGLGVIGGVICYFILRKVHPIRAKLFVYIGILVSITSIVISIIFELTEKVNPGFNVNV